MVAAVARSVRSTLRTKEGDPAHAEISLALYGAAIMGPSLTLIRQDCGLSRVCRCGGLPFGWARARSRLGRLRGCFMPGLFGAGKLRRHRRIPWSARY